MGFLLSIISKMAAVTGLSIVSMIENVLEREKQDLSSVDETLKKLTGRDFSSFNNRPDQRRVRLASGGREDEGPPNKRKPPGGVFARLGAQVLEQQARGDQFNRRGGGTRGFPGVLWRIFRLRGRG